METAQGQGAVAPQAPAGCVAPGERELGEGPEVEYLAVLCGELDPAKTRAVTWLMLHHGNDCSTPGRPTQRAGGRTRLLGLSKDPPPAGWQEALPQQAEAGTGKEQPPVALCSRK